MGLQKLLISLELIQKGDVGVIRLNGRLCVPFNEKQRNESMHESHHSKYTIHPEMTKCIKI